MPAGMTIYALSRSVAAKVDRATIQMGCEQLGVALDDHIANLVRFFAPLP